MMLVQALREIRVDARRDEVLKPVWLRLFQLTSNVVLADRNSLDFVLIEQGLELAVWDRCALSVGKIEILDEQHPEDRGDHVTRSECGPFCHLDSWAGLPRSFGCRLESGMIPRPVRRANPSARSEVVVGLASMRAIRQPSASDRVTGPRPNARRHFALH